MRTQTATISAPYSGWNTRDPLDQMKPSYATKLVNIFPDQGYVRTRNGYVLHCNTSESADVETLIEYPLPNGTTQLVAGCNGKLLNVTTSTASTIGSGFTEDKWQHDIMNNVLVLVNGAEAPRHWDGMTLTTPSYTAHAGHGGLDTTKFIQVVQYKNRLYFVEKNSCKVWYGDPDSIVSQLRSIDLSYVLHRGGAVAFCCPWSRDTGAGLQDYLVAVSTEGEVLIYEGTDPNDPAAWGLIARFFLTPPVAGRRAYFNLGSDLLIVHRAGITAIGTLLSQGNDAKYAVVTDVINRSFLDATASFGNLDGWCCMYHPAGQALYVNIPVTGAPEQFVMNPTIGAWTRYVSLPALHWALMEGDIYFGSTGGKVYKADTGDRDLTSTIKAELKTAYNYFGDRASIKRFTLLRPSVKAETGYTFQLAVDVDFKTADYSAVSVGTASLWNTAIWDVALWAAPRVSSDDIYSLTNIGRAAAMSLAIETTLGGFELFAAAITFERGGLF